MLFINQKLALADWNHEVVSETARQPFRQVGHFDSRPFGTIDESDTERNIKCIKCHAATFELFQRSLYILLSLFRRNTKDVTLVATITASVRLSICVRDMPCTKTVQDRHASGVYCLFRPLVHPYHPIFWSNWRAIAWHWNCGKTVADSRPKTLYWWELETYWWFPVLNPDALVSICWQDCHPTAPPKLRLSILEFERRSVSPNPINWWAFLC